MAVGAMPPVEVGQGAPRRLLDDLASLDFAGAGELWRLHGADLGELMGQLERVRRLCEATQVAALGEAIDRGETGGPRTGPQARLSAREWVTRMCSQTGLGPADPAEVSRLVDVTLGVTADADRAPLRDAVTAGTVRLRAATVCLTEMARLQPLLVDGAAFAVCQGYADLAAAGNLRGLHGLRPAMLARYGRDDVLEREHEHAREHAELTGGVRDGALVRYRLTLDLESYAILEAAIGPLSAPRPEPDGSMDPRPAGLRRAHALVDLVQRAIRDGGSTAAAGRARILVTTSLDDLQRAAGGPPAGTAGPRTGAGATGSPPGEAAGPGPGSGSRPGSPTAEVLATVASGTLLPSSVLARLACDGAVHGVVLGTRGEVLHFGTEVRLFTGSQRYALSLRDRHCTFPGCDVPAAWARAHHLVHWLHGGPTTLANAALLCSRHHTVVHRHRLSGWLDPGSGSVQWDLTPGGYDASARAGP